MNNLSVGIFYYITDYKKPGKLYTKTVPVTSPDKTLDSYLAGYHVDLWKDIAKNIDLDYLEHEWYPRGRVNYMIDYLEVITDRCLLKNKDFISQIKEAFPFKKHKFISDRKAHYSCFKCKPRKQTESSTY